MSLTEDRDILFRKVIAKTQFDLTIVLENVHDPHNIGAVIRSCDAVGVREIFILDTEENLKGRKLAEGKTTSTGVRKWITAHRFTDMQECIAAVRQSYGKIYATHLNADSVSLYDSDLTGSIALCFGNKHAGLSTEILQHCDGNIIIPQMGMVQSLNISVACAVTLFEAARQRIASGQYNPSFDESNKKQVDLLEKYKQNTLK